MAESPLSELVALKDSVWEIYEYFTEWGVELWGKLTHNQPENPDHIAATEVALYIILVAIDHYGDRMERWLKSVPEFERWHADAKKILAHLNPPR